MDPFQINRPGSALLEHLFQQGGEMGTRIQAFDWASTSIGSPATWSQSLKVALQILLSSKFPMQVLWGTEYIQFYNDAYIAIAGNKHPSGLGQRGEECWQEVWDFAGPLLDYVMTTGTATWSEDQLMVLNRHGYAEECYFTFSYTPIWEESGTVGGVFIAVNETTSKILSERRERELRIEAQTAREAAERANQLKDQFLAVLSHELRSPLNPILGWAKLLLTRELDPIKTRQALETIERNAQLQAQMINDLLDISRILKDKLELNRVPIQLVSVIEDALETVRAQAYAKSIRLHTQLDRAPLRVLGDANRLQQVIWNLLSNAIKFTDSGGQVTVSLNYDDDFAKVRVTDSGKGITADFLPYVFDHFRQADSMTTKTFGGLGLGLAIAKQIVDMHGGTIRAESSGEGQGATFTVTLPLTSSPVESLRQNDLSTLDKPLRNVYVLVVEDDEDNREVLIQTLQMYGARVMAVESALAAMNLLATTQPDILISDIGMPEMDGLMLMQQIREATHTSQIPAIALTAYVSEADQAQALAAGFQEHLSKPLDSAALIQAILRATGKKSPF